MREEPHRMPADVGSPRESLSFGTDISSLEIAVAVPPDEEGDRLAHELSRTRSGVRRIWPLPPRLPEAVNVIFCELAPELTQCLPWVPGQSLAALVVVTHAMQAPQFKLLRDCTPRAVLHRPFTAQRC